MTTTARLVLIRVLVLGTTAIVAFILVSWLVGCGGDVFEVGHEVPEAGGDAVDQDIADSGADTADAGADVGQDSGHDADADSASQLTDSVAADSVTADSVTGSDGCTLVTHSDGLGQLYQNCTPADTYNLTTAFEACEAWTGGAIPCVADSSCGGGAVHAGPNSNGQWAIWVYAGTWQGWGHVGPVLACPSPHDSQDTAWS